MPIYSEIAEALDMTPVDIAEPDHTPFTDVSEYYAQQFREVNLGVPKSKEHRRKISESVKDNYRENNTRELISKKLKGNTNAKNHSTDEYRKKQSDVMKAAWQRRKLRSK